MRVEIEKSTGTIIQGLVSKHFFKENGNGGINLNRQNIFNRKREKIGIKHGVNQSLINVHIVIKLHVCLLSCYLGAVLKWFRYSIGS